MKPIDKIMQVRYVLGGTFRISKNNVPHLIISMDGVKYSICYFERMNKYRIFYPYPADKQNKITIDTFEKVIYFFKKGRMGKA